MPFFPTSDQVAVAWLKTISGIDPTKVATSLPADAATWASTGFVTAMTVGGSPGSVHVPVSEPVVAVDCWANNANSGKPPWGKAGHLAALIYRATYLAPQPGSFTVLTDFHPAKLRAVYPVSEPRRIPGDESGFARYQLDLQLVYSVAVTP